MTSQRESRRTEISKKRTKKKSTEMECACGSDAVRVKRVNTESEKSPEKIKTSKHSARRDEE